MTDKRCPNCGSDRPGQHYQDGCPGDATLRPLGEPERPVRREYMLIAPHMYPIPPWVKR